MSYHSPLMGVFNGKAMYQSFFYFVSNLCIVASLTSADTIRPLTSATEMALSITVNGVVAAGDHEWIEYNGEHNYRDYRPSTTARPITPKRPANWDPYVADTCGGKVNIPLSFDRLSSFKSSGFPATRDYPLICKWNVKVNYRKCRRARITMRLDGRSRLVDVANCTKGHFTVSPFMKQSRVCGRIGHTPPFHWYFDSQQPEKDVMITMKNMGINDGYSEGVSFTLQGECLPETDKGNVRKMNVGKENDRFHARWMTRLLEDFQTGEGPRIIKAASQPSIQRPSTTAVRPSTTARPNTKRRTVTTRTPSSTTKRSISYVNGDLLWPFLRSPEPPISLQSLLDSQLIPSVVSDDNTTFTVQSSTIPTVNRLESTNPLAPVISNLSLDASNTSDLLYPTNQPIPFNVSSSSSQSQNFSEMNGTVPSLVLDGQPNMSNPISYISLNGQKFIFSKFHTFRKLLP